MRAFVTGAAGFIGSHLAKGLRDQGHEVMGLDNLTGGWIENVPLGVEFRKVELEDYNHTQAVYRFFRPDVVFHFAAYAAEGLSPWVRGFNYRNNVVASANVVNAAIEFGCERFVFASSMAVYGNEPPPFFEAMQPKPIDPYGVAKYAVELDLRTAHDTHGLEWTVIRPHNVYGPGQNLGDPYRNVVGIFMRQAMAGDPLTVFGDGKQTRAFSYVGDIIDPIIRAATLPEASGRVFNLGGETPYSILELAEQVAAEFGETGVEHLPERHEAKHAYCNHAEAKALLGFDPTTDLATGISQMAEWAREAGVRWSETPRIEVRNRLPEYWRR